MANSGSCKTTTPAGSAWCLKHLPKADASAIPFASENVALSQAVSVYIRKPTLKRSCSLTQRCKTGAASDPADTGQENQTCSRAKRRPAPSEGFIFI